MKQLPLFCEAEIVVDKVIKLAVSRGRKKEVINRDLMLDWVKRFEGIEIFEVDERGRFYGRGV